MMHSRFALAYAQWICALGEPGDRLYPVNPLTGKPFVEVCPEFQGSLMIIQPKED